MEKTRFEKKLKIFLTLKMFDLNWHSGIVLRHPNSSPFSCDLNSAPSLITCKGEPGVVGQDVSGSGRRGQNFVGQNFVGQDVTGAISLGQKVVRVGQEVSGAGRRWGKISGAGGHGAEGSGAGIGSPPDAVRGHSYCT